MTIFGGVPMAELRLEDVEAFLGDAGTEALLWEAKGTELPRAAAIAKQGCGFANADDGGYLLLGFERVSGAWRTTGLTFPDEAPVWIGNVLRTRLRPVPPFDVRDWPVNAGTAAVVEIGAVAEPPCVTTDGQIYVRVAGATVPVTEVIELRSLYERGRVAVDAAEKAAVRAAQLMVALSSAPPLEIVLALAPVGAPADIARRLFTDGFANRMREVAVGLPREPLFPSHRFLGSRRKLSSKSDRTA